MTTIRVSAIVMRDGEGRMLTVRKRGTEMLMFPGGKPEPGEDPRDTAIREFAEELGVRLDGLLLRTVGEFSAPAANEPGHEVVAHVFEHPFVEVGEPLAEIDRVEWIDPGEARHDIAPLSTMLFPILRESGRAPGRIAVFTGSAAGASPAFAEAAIELASACARSGVGIVTGGGRVGLMGVIADAALRAGGEVFGVIPQPLVEGEIAHESLTRLEVVSDMHARKHRMSVLSDAFVALPGGAGTLEELFEAWTWQQLGMLAKPVALYDVEGYWQPLLGMLDRMVDEGFLSAPLRESLIVARTPDELFSALATWVPPRRK